MGKIDIMQENLCIQRIISVIKGRNIHHHKLLRVKERHSDAFVFVTSGSCAYRFDDETEFTASAGDVFYLPCRSTYTMYIHSEDYKFIFCDFEFSETGAKHGALYQNQKDKGADMLFAKLLNRHNSVASNAYTECMSILYSIYSTLMLEARRGYIGKSNEENIQAAKQYIDEGFGNPELTVKALAERLGISEVYFRRLFKSRYGIAPSKYLISVRLRNAQKLMRYPFLSLEECATQSGFASLQYFCRIFKKEIGIPPGKYRKNP